MFSKGLEASTESLKPFSFFLFSTQISSCLKYFAFSGQLPHFRREIGLLSWMDEPILFFSITWFLFIPYGM